MSTQSHQSNASHVLATFVSDLHLCQEEMATVDAFLDFLQKHAMKSQALYLLGDIFETWAGDDDADDAFNALVIHAIKEVSSHGVQVYWIAGNRDFLVGQAFAQMAGITILPDPFVLEITGKRIVISHGDAQCTDDQQYMAFRNQVRQAAWQQGFLAMPLLERKKIIAGVRQTSQHENKMKSQEIMDVNAQAVEALFNATDTKIMIHGHTHRPACHRKVQDGNTYLRYVLPDWDVSDDGARGGWLTVDSDGSINRLDIHAHVITD